MENRCVECGQVINNDTSRPVSSQDCFFNYSPYCLDCESNYFKKIEEVNGSSVALFICCACFRVPCFPLILEEDLWNAEDKWVEYIKTLIDKDKYYDERDTPLNFFDGETFMKRLFGKDFTETDFGKFSHYEKARLDSLPGTEEQRRRWGSELLCKGTPMSAEVYNELDRQYHIWTTRYKGQSITPQLENTIITICKRNMIADILVQNGNYAGAQKVQKMVDDLMASEQMRKKDEKPVENYRIDAQIDALEKKGLLEDGKFLNFSDTVKALIKGFVTKPKYDYTLDVADQMLLDFYNNTRANANLIISHELPEDLIIEDVHGEFAQQESEDEQKRKKYAGCTPLRKEKVGE